MWSTSPPVSKQGPKLNYKPLELCEDTVFKLASTGHTKDEIALLFNVSKLYIDDHYLTAFRAGKAACKLKPRQVVWNLIDRLEEELAAEISLKNCPTLTNDLLKACNLVNSYLPKEIIIETKPESELSDEELAAKIAALSKVKNALR